MSQHIRSVIHRDELSHANSADSHVDDRRLGREYRGGPESLGDRAPSSVRRSRRRPAGHRARPRRPDEVVPRAGPEHRGDRQLPRRLTRRALASRSSAAPSQSTRRRSFSRGRSASRSSRADSSASSKIASSRSTPTSTRCSSPGIARQPIHRAGEGDAAPPAHAFRGAHRVGIPGLRARQARSEVPQLLDGAPPANTPAVRNDTTPGARWLYSGGGMTIAQLVCDRRVRRGVPDALMDRLMLRPAGMTRSTYENPLPTSRRGEAAAVTSSSTRPCPADSTSIPRWPPPACGRRLGSRTMGDRSFALVSRRTGWCAVDRNGEADGLEADAPAAPVRERLLGARRLGAGDGGLADVLAQRRDEGFVADVFMRPNTRPRVRRDDERRAGGLLSEIERAFAEEYGFGAPPRINRTVVSVP